ncbi:S-layer homology domain-containing protein [Saccharibacillus deserti]|uniref:S-layer homology domain-containing protein n=1 Tax=Saccharibacillus deserti TaxID=1634444 RepID=UPI0015545E00|nr:S-layer homology domain-containing protein [Saccharibacillus deserti]
MFSPLIAVASSSSQSVALGYSGIIYARDLQLSGENNLTSLQVSPGTLDGAFDPEDKEYAVTVTDDVYDIDVTVTSSVYATTRIYSPTIEEEGRVAADEEPVNVPLSGPVTPINVVVTAQNGDEQVYTLTVTREAPPSTDASLSGLMISSGTLDPEFAAEKTQYRATVTNDVYRIDVTPTANSDAATITVEGAEIGSGGSVPVDLQVGENTVDVVVTPQSGASRTYQVIVTRQTAPVNPNPDPGPVTPSPAPVTPTTPVTPTPTPTPTPPANGLEVIVNGQPTTIVATGGTTQVEGETVFTATIDTARLATLLSGAGANQSVIIPVRTEADRVIATLTGEAAGLLSGSQATLRIETPLGNYTIPSSQLNLSAAANSLGLPANSADLLVNVVIEKSEPQVQTALSQAAANAGFTGVSAPIDFTITASSGGRTVEVNSFTEYVEREIPLPAGVDPNRVTTAVVIEPNGTVRHVPTEVTRTQTTDYARVNSLTNSSYALIFNPKQFPDVAGKWSQAAVNDMASRLVVNGIGTDRYNPEGAVTRAEFAAILVRALGLPSGGQAGGFSDIAAADWYAGSAATANAYGLITGYPDGTFRPNDTITRQEAFAILDRAAQIVPLQAGEGSSELGSYRDRAKVADWAKSSAQAVLAAGLAEGSGGWLRPLETLSRAESAAVAQRLLQQANLIDQ